jgi:2-(1,2-epoxy-1,2-dihydrophenyl)acetyl-CoA isomerase
VSDPVLLTIEDGIARVVLNRPESGNAINISLARALLDAAIRCDTDPDVRCVVIAGNGKLFCAGGDVELLGGAGDKLPAILSELIAIFHAAVIRLAKMPKPLLTLVNGPAAGAGMSLSLLGDIVLSSRTAHYTPAYGALGLTADGGLSWLLPRLVGLRKAQEIILTNRRIKADEAEAMGLITRAVDETDLETKAIAMAKQLADAPVAALGAARALILQSFHTSLETQLECELNSMVIAGGGEAREGLAAFLAKRAPQFKGL